MRDPSVERAADGSVYVYIGREGDKVERTTEEAGGLVHADWDHSGDLIGVEVLSAERVTIDGHTAIPDVALPEFECPSCGATTRARMADQVSDEDIERASYAMYLADYNAGPQGRGSRPFTAEEWRHIDGRKEYDRRARAAVAALRGEG